MKYWYTVTLVVDNGNIENGPIIDSWEHPFNAPTAEDAWNEACWYYKDSDAEVTHIRPSTKEEVKEFFDHITTPREDEELPFF